MLAEYVACLVPNFIMLEVNLLKWNGNRESYIDLPEVMLGNELSKEFHNSIEGKTIEEYYNIKTNELLKII